MDATVCQDVLPPALLAAAQVDALALSRCPNYWVPRAVVEGLQPAVTAAEQVVRQLWSRMACDALLEPDATGWTGAEYWCQIYERGRGLTFHFDKDEHVMKASGAMVNPLRSSVLYLTGSSGGGAGSNRGTETSIDSSVATLRQAPTVLIDQRYDHERQCALPDEPAWTSLVFPVENQYLIFAGQQAHGVLEQQQQEHQEQQEQQEQWEQQEQPHQDTPPPPLPLPSQQRATLLVNWWARRPEGVERATEEEVQQGKLAAARESLELSVEEKQCSRQRRIQFTSIDAPPLQAGELLPVDELLVQCGVALTGSGACDAVTIRHAGLTLFPLDEEQVDPAHPLHVMAAFLPAADLAGSSVSVSVSVSGSGSGSGSSSGERS